MAGLSVPYQTGALDYQSGGSIPQQRGTFWRGADNNVYVAGSQGTNNAGNWDANTYNYWTGLGYKQTADPVSPVFPGTAPTADDGRFDVNRTGTGSADAAQRSLLQQGLNTGIARMEGDLRVLDQQENDARLRVDDQYGRNRGRVTVDYNTGVKNLGQATDRVNESKERSLDNLRRWMQGMGQGYMNQLGAMGAGDSSAAGMINYALGQQGSRERGGVLQDAGYQLQGIQSNLENLQTDYTRAIQDLDLWKESTLFDLTDKYQQARNNINNNILDARQRAAAEMELTQEAVNFLSQLENQYRQQANDVVARYQSISGPGTQLDQRLTSYNDRPVRQASLDGIGMPTQVNPESGASAFLRRRDDDIYSNPLGGF